MAAVTNLNTPLAISACAATRPGRVFHRSTVAFDRPGGAPVTYTAGDVVSDKSSTAEHIEFVDCAQVDGGSGRIMGASVLTDENNAATAFDLLVFRSAPTDHQDNDPLELVAADRNALVAVFSMPAAQNVNVDTTNGSYYHFQAAADGTAGFTPPRAYTCDDDATSLYGLLVTRAAWVPEAGTILYVALDLELD